MKYYTPDIGEFHVGFEFEYEDIIASGASDYFKGTILDSKEVGDVFYNLIEHGMDVRVKYLDREDIESMGFKFVGRAACDWYEMEGRWEDGFCSYGYWTKIRLMHCHGEEESGIRIMVFEHSFEEKETTLFQGQIKNKTELKKLLIQLRLV
jgi:hypothetical protein